MSKIPEVEIEIGDNLYLQIKDVSFIPFKKGVTSALPEDCYEDEPAECDWRDENCRLVIKKNVYVNTHKEKKLLRTEEYDFDCDPGLAVEYYDLIVEQIEENLKGGLND